MFKLLVLLGKITKISVFPLCRVMNDPKTERYTLRRDGWVIIQEPGSKSYNMVPVNMVSQKLVDKFEAELEP